MDSPAVIARHARAGVPEPIDEDRVSIHAGIQLVGGRLARRIVLCGLRYAERLLPEAVAEGCSAGVVVRLDRNGPQPAIVITSERADRAN